MPNRILPTVDNSTSSEDMDRANKIVPKFPITTDNTDLALSAQSIPMGIPVSEYIPEERIRPRQKMKDIRRDYAEDELLTQPETKVYLGAKNFAFMGGVVLMAMAMISLFAPGVVVDMAPMIVTKSSGWFLGYFPLNLVLKSVLFLVGIGGFLASTHLGASINWARFVAIVMGAFAVMGLIAPMSTFFGYMPLYGANILLNATFSIMGIYFAYYSNPKNATRTDY